MTFVSRPLVKWNEDSVTGLGKAANKSSSHACITQHRYKENTILFVKYFRLTLHIKIDACVDSFKLVLSWTPILSRLISRRCKVQCISCTHSLPILKPHNCRHRITNGTAVECCCSGLNYSLVRRPRDPAWWIYLRLKKTTCIFRSLNFSSTVSNCAAGALVQNKKAFPTFWSRIHPSIPLSADYELSFQFSRDQQVRNPSFVWEHFLCGLI